jgi:hypothetical protein
MANPGALARARDEILADPARTDRAIAAMIDVDPHTVGRARRQLGMRTPVDRHAPAAADPRPLRGYYQPPDPEIEGVCIACTLRWAEGGWQHDRACPLRRS